MSSIAKLAKSPLINASELDRRIRSVKRGQAHVIKNRKTLRGLDRGRVAEVCGDLRHLIVQIENEFNLPHPSPTPLAPQNTHISH